jgi:phosphatidylglycerol:prolipoprotein diacylglycerol transferase
MFILLTMSWKFGDRLKDGDIFLTYLVIYPVGRFLLDFLRLDASQVGGININQTIMAVVAISAATALFMRHRPNRTNQAA